MSEPLTADPQPRIVKARGSRFLAVSPDGFRHSIGVIADTEDEVIKAYWAALVRRRMILRRRSA